MILVTGLLHSIANLAAWQAGGVAVLVAARCLLYCTLLYCTVLCFTVLYCRCLLGASVHTLWEAAFTLTQETTLPSHRTATSAAINISEQSTCPCPLYCTQHVSRLTTVQ